MLRTILSSDWYNALYEDGILKESGKPAYLDAETIARLHPDAQFFTVPQPVYDDVLNGEGYPPELSRFPLSRCTRLR
jgi:hypothetical protein